MTSARQCPTDIPPTMADIAARMGVSRVMAPPVTLIAAVPAQAAAVPAQTFNQAVR